LLCLVGTGRSRLLGYPHRTIELRRADSGATYRRYRDFLSVAGRIVCSSARYMRWRTCSASGIRPIARLSRSANRTDDRSTRSCVTGVG